MSGREIIPDTELGFIATLQSDGWFISWAKMGPIRGKDPLDEPSAHVWVQFGRTRDEAVQKLLSDLGLNCV